MDSVDLPVVPIFIHLSPQNDDVTFAEFKVPGLFAFVVV